ncbi:MAG: DUF4091 domain-containing protein [Kiritimatiellae bacterium]|nr:DUF4091 domain-containing protein [Kiritimatiellia bacterium]
MIWRDDSVELFLFPARQPDYRQFVVNAGGSRWNSGGKLWDWSAKAVTNEHGWMCEMRIPFEGLQSVPPAGEKWRLNVARNMLSGPKNSCWVLSQGPFKEAAGSLIFMEKALSQSAAAELGRQLGLEQYFREQIKILVKLRGEYKDAFEEGMQIKELRREITEIRQGWDRAEETAGKDDASLETLSECWEQCRILEERTRKLSPLKEPLLQTTHVWVEDALVKVFPDTPAPARQEAPVIRVQCAKNEYEPAQLHIRSKPLENLSLKTGDLSHESGKYVIPSKNITWNFAGYIPINKNSVGSAPERVVKAAPCEIPDPLLDNEKMTLFPNRTQSIWITFYVPKNAPAGKYSGRVEVVSGDGGIAVPVELEVWDFAIPGEKHLFVVNWFRNRYAEEYMEKAFFDQYGGGCWIWSPASASKVISGDRALLHGRGQACFRRNFDLPGKCKKARLIVRGDSSHVVFVNGTKAGGGDDWFIEKTYDIGGHLVRGQNLIAMKMKKPSGSSGGVYAALEVDLEGGGQIRLATDNTWRAQTADKTDAASWNLPGTDDSKWPFAGKAVTAIGARGAYTGLMYEDERYWKILPAYLANLAAHRNNICGPIPLALIKTYREDDGTLSFDYKNFDRYIKLLESYGLADRLELGHLGICDRAKGTVSINVWDCFGWNRKTGTPYLLKEEEIFVRLKDLAQHLESKGWIDKAVLHLADEPFAQNIKAYKELSRKVHQAVPRLKRIDAINTFDFGDDLDVWVPVLHCLDNFYEFYRNAQRRGKELWYYSCNNPWSGFYPNRGLDYPLTHMRLFHWLNYRYELAGYLHWGYNCWYMDDPFGKPVKGEIAAPGDAFIVYPGKNGPLNSLRWEAHRDGIEDYEYLWALGEKMKKLKTRFGAAAEDFDPAQRGKELCNRLITGMGRVDYDPVRFRQARAAIAREILEADAEPAALVWTFPPDGAEITRGSAVIQVYGAAEPGAKIKINNTKGVYAGDDGRFCSTATFFQRIEGADNLALNIEISGKNKSRTITRTFRFRK